jgi:glycosyltransferase-like protein
VKIALLTYSTKPRGGVVHTLALAEALAALGEQVTVWSLGRGGDERFFRPVSAKVTLRVVPFQEIEGEEFGARILRSIDVLRAAFDRSGYDVVHAQDCLSANAAGRCIRTVHHIDHFTTPELAACHERAIVEPSAHVCVSAAVAAELRVGWGLAATVIPNGVDADRFAAVDLAAIDRMRAEHGRYVLSVGGIEPRKGSVELLDAYALLRERLSDVRLVIVGGETLFDYRDYRARWDVRAAELDVAPLLLGPVPHDDLPTIVAGAAAFAFTSTKEGFGLAAMEALAAGVPIVVRDLPVLREVFEGAATFATTPAGFADGLADAIDRPDEHRRLTGTRLAAAHTWTAAARRHRTLYRCGLAHSPEAPDR